MHTSSAAVTSSLTKEFMKVINFENLSLTRTVFGNVELRNNCMYAGEACVNPASQCHALLVMRKHESYRSPALFPYFTACSKRGRFARMCTLSKPETMEQKRTCARLLLHQSDYEL